MRVVLCVGLLRLVSCSKISSYFSHVDLDCFYAQVEVMHEPQLRGKPVGVLQNQTISTANYEARRRGVPKMTHRTKALEICPDLIIINSDMNRYRRASEAIFEEFLLKQHLNSDTCIMEQKGIDEAYIDISQEIELVYQNTSDPILLHQAQGAIIEQSQLISKKNALSKDEKMLILGSQYASQLRRAMSDETGYECSIGIASNKYLAKIASNYNKPNNQAILFDAIAKSYLASLSIRTIPTVGYKTAQQLQSIGVSIIRDIALHHSNIVKHLGSSMAQFLLDKSNGIDTEPVKYKGPVKSIGAELTFLPVDSLDALDEKVMQLAKDICDRTNRHMEKHQQKPTQLLVKHAEKDYSTSFQSHSSKIENGPITATSLHRQAMQLFKRHLSSSNIAIYRIALVLSNFIALREDKPTLTEEPSPKQFKLTPQKANFAPNTLSKSLNTQSSSNADFILAKKLQEQEKENAFHDQYLQLKSKAMESKHGQKSILSFFKK